MLRTSCRYAVRAYFCLRKLRGFVTKDYLYTIYRPGLLCNCSKPYSLCSPCMGIMSVFWTNQYN